MPERTRFLLDTLFSPEVQELVDALPIAFFVKDAASRIVMMNQACEEQWGIAFELVRGTTASQFFHEEQIESFLARDQAVFASRKLDVFEEVLWNSKFRERRICKTLKKPIYLPDGRPQYLICLSIDITEQKDIAAELKVSSEKLRRLYELSQLGIALTDMNGQYIEFNQAFEKICGYTCDELNKLDYWSLTPREYAEQEAKQLELLRQTGTYGPYEKEYIRKDGTRVPLRLNGVLIEGKEGEPYIWSIVEDISERNRAEESLQIANLIYQSSSEAIMVTDERNRIVDINGAFTRLTGYAFSDVQGKDPKLMRSGLHDSKFYVQLWHAVREFGQWQGEIWDRNKNGDLMAKWLNINVIRNPDGSIYRHIGQFSDITEKKKKDELIWRQANYDTLTGLPNRRLFRDRLEQEIKKAQLSHKRLGLLFIDLDRFKEINDGFGHQKGDELLSEAALRIRHAVRESDTVARLGGDEFTVILPDFGHQSTLERLAQEIISTLSKPFTLGPDQAYISASIGITICPDDATDTEDLIRHADRAMYQSKENGRSQFTYFTPAMQRVAEEKLSLSNELRHALERQQLSVHYQPIIDLKTGHIVKAEALLRWSHPEKGAISPFHFIPLAEESGFIIPIGDWVFRQAARAVASWQKKFGKIIQVSVNNSPIQLSDETACSGWPTHLAELGLPGHAVTIEITEGLLIKDSPRVKRNLLEFRNHGVEVSIDDFGTGFSSLSYLKQFDIDYLKIDRSFVNNLAEDESDKALTEAIIVMAHKLGIKTIAEGIETPAQHEMLKSFGCDYAQGYLYSRPIPETEFEALLAEKKLH